MDLIERRLASLVERRQQKRLLEQSLTDFTQAGWRYIDPAPYVHNWHLEAIAEHLQAVTDGEIRKLLINVPPRTSKSSLVSVAWPAWTWIQDGQESALAGPEVQFLFASYAQSLSLRDSVKTRRLIESPWFQERWGRQFALVGDQNTKIRFENDKGGYRLATSVGGALTGEGGSIIVVDDPHNALEVESDQIRQSTLQWWDESLSTRLNDPKTGAYVVIMQRLYENDLTGHVLSKEEGDWTHLCLPMRYDPRRHCETALGFSDPRTEDGELLWPDRFGEREVVNLEKRLGPFAASGQLQQSPTPRGGGIFKSDWWKQWPPEGEEFDEAGKPLKPLRYPPMEYILCSVDTAMTEKEENDWSACTVWGVFKAPASFVMSEFDRAKRVRDGLTPVLSTSDPAYPAIMLMDAWRARLPFHELVQRIIETCRTRKVDRLIIEAKANGISVGQEITRLCGGEEFGVTLDVPKGDKVARARSVEHWFANGLVFAPERKFATMVQDEMASFPKGEHDDLVDSSVAALRYMRSQGLAQLAEEREEDLRRTMAPPGPEENLYDV